MKINDRTNIKIEIFVKDNEKCLFRISIVLLL